MAGKITSLWTDLSGQRFGRLTVLQRIHIGWTNRNPRDCECRCECGKTVWLAANNLKGGNAKSCGCLSRDVHRKDGTAFRNVLRAYKSNARAKKLEFSLSDVAFQAFIGAPCQYCGEPPSSEHRSEGGDVFLANGIDRIDVTRGYVTENCVSCCSTCNYMKRTLSVEVFIAHCRKIVRKANGV